MVEVAQFKIVDLVNLKKLSSRFNFQKEHVSAEALFSFWQYNHLGG
jgi:hypothetical protein